MWLASCHIEAEPKTYKCHQWHSIATWLLFCFSNVGLIINGLATKGIQACMTIGHAIAML